MRRVYDRHRFWSAVLVVMAVMAVAPADAQMAGHMQSGQVWKTDNGSKLTIVSAVASGQVEATYENVNPDMWCHTGDHAQLSGWQQGNMVSLSSVMEGGCDFAFSWTGPVVVARVNNKLSWATRTAEGVNIAQGADWGPTLIFYLGGF